jgi:hypothetical protein
MTRCASTSVPAAVHGAPDRRRRTCALPCKLGDRRRGTTGAPPRWFRPLSQPGSRYAGQAQSSEEVAAGHVQRLPFGGDPEVRRGPFCRGESEVNTKAMALAAAGLSGHRFLQVVPCTGTSSVCLPQGGGTSVYPAEANRCYHLLSAIQPPRAGGVGLGRPLTRGAHGSF